MRPLPAVGQPLRKGELVRLTCQDRTVDAVVTIASPNGRSIVLSFEALLAGHAGMMPVMQKDDGSYHSLVGSVPLTIVRR